MRTIARSLAGAIAGVLLVHSAALGESTGRCTHESWSLDGTPLVATLCVPALRTPHVTISETFTRNETSFANALDLDVAGGSEITRAVDNVALAPLGSAKSLHLTIVYRNGVASVEHALLLPGALVLK